LKIVAVCLRELRLQHRLHQSRRVLINLERGDFRLALNSGARADIPGPPLWATARSRCAPARCAGARAERLVVG
jgi:hypothetical protein